MKGDTSTKYIFLLVFKGFGVLTIAYFLPWFFLMPFLTSIFPSAPEDLISRISSSAIAPVIGTLYLSLKTRQIPTIIQKWGSLYTAIAGMAGVWLLTLILSSIVGKIELFNKELFEHGSPTNMIYIFLYMIWAPLVEETFFRGYVLEILRRWSNIGALLLSSFFFTVPHLFTQDIMFGGTVGLLMAIEHFIMSVILGLSYMQGGLISAIVVHAFANFYR